MDNFKVVEFQADRLKWFRGVSTLGADHCVFGEGDRQAGPWHFLAHCLISSYNLTFSNGLRFRDLSDRVKANFVPRRLLGTRNISYANVLKKPQVYYAVRNEALCLLNIENCII